MSFSLKICALCRKELQRTTVEVAGTDITQYVCPTRIEYPYPPKDDWRLSHYWIEYKGHMYNQIINIPPYSISNPVVPNIPHKSFVVPLYFDKDGKAQNDFTKIVALPRLPLDRLDKLVERIKLLILFS